MPRKRFTNEQIAFALRQASERRDGGRRLCGERGVSEPTFDRWKKQFVGMGVPEIRPVCALKVAQLGRLATVNVSGSPFGSVAAGWKL